MRRSLLLQLGLLLFSIYLILLFGRSTSADPALPLPTLPICGDESDSPLTLNCPDLSPLVDVQLYKVPGNDMIDVNFDFVYREAGFNNELGLFYVDDQAGNIGNLQPGDPAYYAAALSQATIIFPSGAHPYTPDVSLPLTSGRLMVFFIVQNDTVANFLANNPTNDPLGAPLAFFSMDELNTDGTTDHFVGFQNDISEYSQFGFEDETGGGDNDFDDVVYTIAPPPIPVLIDHDGDGLPDLWEINGVDTDLDDIPDLDLQAMGAISTTKDIFIWIDWLEAVDHSHRPSTEAIDLVKAAFAAQGIQLHVHFGSAIPETTALQEVIDFSLDTNTSQLTLDVSKIKALREQYFLGNGNHPGRASVYHHVLAVHDIGQQPSICSLLAYTTPAGWAIGSDFVIGLNRARERGELTPTLEALVFMHELGHTLGLGHGGVKLENGLWVPDHTDYKPNHLSIMNQAFAVWDQQGLTVDGVSGVLDFSIFSPADIPSINELNLTESGGLNSTNPEVSKYSTKWFCGLNDFNGETVANANSPIDWNCDGDTNDSNVQANINKSTLPQCSVQFESELSTSNEWQHLSFTNGTIGTIPNIIPEFPAQITIDHPGQELPFEYLLEPDSVYLPLIGR
ncbi:MAG: DUF4114 domain-containing protein [Ardenticatenaceae bacterium]|nr:DUF4114 domain-containing protein [Ardenticatenaceae bacterium]